MKLIVAHLFGLKLFIKEELRDSNLYFDLSTLQVTSTKRVMKAINYFGSEKIFFGTDTPYGKNNLVRNINRIRDLPISEADKENILGDNLSKLLDIG